MEHKDIENLDLKGLVKAAHDYQGQRISDPIFAELIRREILSVENLRGSIEKLDETTTKYSSRLVMLTVWIVILTFVMTIATVAMLIKT